MNLFSSHKSCLWQCVFFNPNFEQRTSVHTLKVAWKMEQEALRKAEKARTTRAADDLWNCEPCYVFPSRNLSIEFLNCATLLKLLHSDTLWLYGVHTYTSARTSTIGFWQTYIRTSPIFRRDRDRADFALGQEWAKRRPGHALCREAVSRAGSCLQTMHKTCRLWQGPLQRCTRSTEDGPFGRLKLSQKSPRRWTLQAHRGHARGHDCHILVRKHGERTDAPLDITLAAYVFFKVRTFLSARKRFSWEISCLKSGLTDSCG